MLTSGGRLRQLSVSFLYEYTCSTASPCLREAEVRLLTLLSAVFIDNHAELIQAFASMSLDSLARERWEGMPRERQSNNP